MNRAVAVGEFFFDVVRLARHAIVTPVHIEFDVAGVVAGLQQLVHAAFMTFFGGADEVVVLDIESFPRIGVERGNLVDEFTGRLACGVGILLHFEPVLVGSRQEVHVIATQTVPATDCVGDDRRVGVPEVGLCRHVIDRSRRRELWHHSNLRSTR